MLWHGVFRGGRGWVGEYVGHRKQQTSCDSCFRLQSAVAQLRIVGSGVVAGGLAESAAGSSLDDHGSSDCGNSRIYQSGALRIADSQGPIEVHAGTNRVAGFGVAGGCAGGEIPPARRGNPAVLRMVDGFLPCESGVGVVGFQSPDSTHEELRSVADYAD